MAKHTPTPWSSSDCIEPTIVILGPADETGENRRHVAQIYASGDGVGRANADFIVRAANAHEALVVALEKMMKWIGPPPADRHSFDSRREDAWDEAKAALKLAKS